MRRIQLTLVALIISACAIAQIKMPPPSPTFELKGTVGLAEVIVVYSRPSAKGREVAGNLIPYNEVWRTGANASTKITFSLDVKLNGNAVPAGEYALYTMFTEETATIILSKNLTWWGALGYDAKDDLLRFEVPVKHPSSHYETFTMSFSDFTMNSANLNMKWEHTKAMDIRKLSHSDHFQAQEVKLFYNFACKLVDPLSPKGIASCYRREMCTIDKVAFFIQPGTKLHSLTIRGIGIFDMN